MLPYALTIFTSAFLLFQIQPLIAKYILPWFGGTPAVWSTSLLFFQVFLLLGYVYAHLSIRWLRTRWQVIVHLALLLLALTQLPATPSDAWQPAPGDPPALRILLLLAASIGLPYLALSATAPLIQAWFSHIEPDKSPYRLYGLSNAGSLIALVSYPFLFEPLLTRGLQATVWSFGFVAFAAIGAFTALWTWRRERLRNGQENAPRTSPLDEPGGRPATGLWLLWLALPTAAVVLLLAFTNQITLDVSVIPFLWVLPLSLYLLTFVIAFDNDRWYIRPVFAALLIPAAAGVTAMLYLAPNVAIWIQISIYSAALFVFCMVCHGELARLRPHPHYLTGFYLMVALGGALGGVFVALIAPAIFPDFFEVHLGALAVLVLALYLMLFDGRQALFRKRPVWLYAALIAIPLALAGAFGRIAITERRGVIVETRNFYGPLAVWEQTPDTPDERRWLVHGVIYHGVQFTEPAKRRWATSYFAGTSGVGRALANFERAGGRRIGLVGMGIGTLATYGRGDDYIRIYEINPEVRRITEEYFTYLDDSQAEVEIVMGDARLSLEREAAQHFDILILDAFSSDAVPVHLLTREAFATYLRHLREDGVIAVNVTNRHVELEPVVRNVADYYGLDAVYVASEGGEREVLPAEWMLLSRNTAFLESPALEGGLFESNPADPEVRLWTDDYSSLVPVVRWK